MDSSEGFDLEKDGDVFFYLPILVCFAWFLWGINVWVFRRTRVDYASVLGLDKNSTLLPFEIFFLALVVAGVVRLSQALYFASLDIYNPILIPLSLYMLGFGILIGPLKCTKSGAGLIPLRILWRILMPSKTDGVSFSEVVLGDILTSFSRVFADIPLPFCIALQMLTSHRPDTSIPEETQTTTGLFFQSGGYACGRIWIIPLLSSSPFILRIRQCIFLYRRTGHRFPHLINAVKYASVLPPIWISAYLHFNTNENEDFLRSIWFFFIMMSSIYSFLWDVIMDFGLFRWSHNKVVFRNELLFKLSDFFYFGERPTSTRASLVMSRKSDIPKGLDENHGCFLNWATSIENNKGIPSRHDEFEELTILHKNEGELDAENITDIAQKLVKHSARPARSNYIMKINCYLWWCFERLFYFLVIVLNFTLRMMWSFRISALLSLNSNGEALTLAFCEIFRRFLWLFVRVEWEYIENLDRSATKKDKIELDDISEHNVDLEQRLNHCKSREVVEKLP